MRGPFSCAPRIADLTATSASAPRHKSGLIAVVIAQLAFGLLAMTLCIPSLQDWPAIFGASQAAVQLTFSGYVAAYGGLQLVYGPWSDRLGRKPVLMTGLAVAMGGSVAAALAPNLTLLTLARVVQGAGCAACMVVGRALVQDLFSGPERTRMMAFVGMTMGLVPPTATLLGGHIHVHWGWQANFVLLAALGAVLLVAAWRGLPDIKPASAAPTGSPVSGYAQLSREPAFLLFVAISASTTAAFYTFLAGAPIVLAGYGVTPERIGWYIMWPPMAYIVGNLITSRLVHRLGDRRIMALGQVITAGAPLGLLALGLAGWHSPMALAVPMVLMGIGHGLLVPPTLAGTVGVLPALAGSAAAVAGLMQQIIGAAGGYTVGWVTHQGPVNLALLMLGWTLLGAAAQVALHRYARRA